MSLGPGLMSIFNLEDNAVCVVKWRGVFDRLLITRFIVFCCRRCGCVLPAN